MAMKLDIWLKNILESIEELADDKFQERVWLQGLGPEASSFTEAVNRLRDFVYDDLISELDKLGLLSNGDKSKLAEYHKSLIEYGNSGGWTNSHAEILEDPKWHEIRNKASDVFEILSNVNIPENT